MKWYQFLLILYPAIMNIAGFCGMGIDKNRAKKRKWRIKERTLFTIAALGGSIGSIVGMYAFRHKTKHVSFVIGMPAILFGQLLIIVIITYF